MNLRFVGQPVPDLTSEDQLDVTEQVLIGDVVAFERIGPTLVRLRKLGKIEQGMYPGTKFVLEKSAEQGALDIRALG